MGANFFFSGFSFLLLSTEKMLVRLLPPWLRSTRVAIGGCRSLSSSGRWFDAVIPEDDAETKRLKDKEREVVMKRLTRSIFVRTIPMYVHFCCARR